MELKNLSFEAWVKHIFDHPVTDPAWYWDSDRPWWDYLSHPATTIRYMTTLFEDTAELCSPYSDAQLKQGFWFLASHGSSDYMFTLTNRGLRISDRVRCIESFFILYKNLFALRCSSHLSHMIYEKAPEEVSPLNSICYMWWDIIPLSGNSQNSTQCWRDDACLAVMEKTLQLDSIACQESALHGLGHWKSAYPERVQAIIDNFLEKNLDPDIRHYARSARKGRIL